MNNILQDPFETIARLRDENQRLQTALAFWLPDVSPSEDQEIFERCANDSMLLRGSDSEEMAAYQLGWIKLRGEVQTELACRDNDVTSLKLQLGQQAEWVECYIKREQDLMLEVSALQSKLAAFESSLASVRAERPEVEDARNMWMIEVDEIRGQPVHAGNLHVFHIGALLKAVDELLRTEAAWRCARDVWTAETAKLKSEVDQYTQWVEPQLVRLGHEMARVWQLQQAVVLLLNILSVSDRGLSAEQQATIDALALPQPPVRPGSDLVAYGYAPGNYTITCYGCVQYINDCDKRATRCKPCAELLAQRQAGKP